MLICPNLAQEGGAFFFDLQRSSRKIAGHAQNQGRFDPLRRYRGVEMIAKTEDQNPPSEFVENQLEDPICSVPTIDQTHDKNHHQHDRFVEKFQLHHMLSTIFVKESKLIEVMIHKMQTIQFVSRVNLIEI
jgi:hypothetical protein